MYSWWFCEQNNSYPGLIWWDWFGRKPMDVWNRPTQLPRIKWVEPRNVFYNVVMDPLKGLLDALVSLRSILESVFSRVLEIHICRKYTESTRQPYTIRKNFLPVDEGICNKMKKSKPRITKVMKSGRWLSRVNRLKLNNFKLFIILIYDKDDDGDRSDDYEEGDIGELVFHRSLLSAKSNQPLMVDVKTKC